MAGWCGIALALRAPDEDQLASRLPTYLHPLAGRSLAWHVLRAMSELEPAARELYLVAPDLDPALAGEIPARVVGSGEPWRSLDGPAGEGTPGSALVVDAAAAGLCESLVSLIAADAPAALRDGEGAALAVWLPWEALMAAGSPSSLEELADGVPGAAVETSEELFLVRDRSSLARASELLRQRIVERHMRQGVTFLSPTTVIVDVDVTMGPDTIIYPGVVIEGQTRIGAETVVGPGCRIIDAEIGTGVELKGWNYVVRNRLRNRAVLEPYVRRGFD